MQPCCRQTRHLWYSHHRRLQICVRDEQYRCHHVPSKLIPSPNRSAKIPRFGDGNFRTKQRETLHRRDARKSPRTLFRSQRPTVTSELEGKLIRGKVHQVLATLSNLWEEKSIEDDRPKDYITQLGPDKGKWEECEDTVKQLLDTIDGNLSSPEQEAVEQSAKRSLVEQLIKDARRPDWSGNMTRTLKFAFLDHVLNGKDSLQNPGISNVIDLRYPTEWYVSARYHQRHIHLHVGPTNSGKTYNALKRLEESGDGYYAGPLRLLAHEVFSRFNNRGVACDLVTGDDVRLSDNDVKLYCSTVEMVDISKRCEVGVVDEIQMIGAADRGWAWTRVLLGSQARELHLCGEARVVPLIRELVASMGDTLHIHQYDRLNPLKVMSKSLKGNLKNLRKGDCIVSFSVMNIHALKRQIELETNKRVAIVYGSLPPETRAQQAALFNDPDNDYDFLVASDAVGMGLNLSIKRIIFEKTLKYNGSSFERLSIPQLKQIAGRAGRYRTSNDDKSRLDAQNPKTKVKTNVGLVTCLDEADLPFIHRALSTEAPPIKAAGLHPPGEVYERAGKVWPKDIPFEYIMRRVHRIVSLNKRFELCDVDDQLDVARAIDKVSNLTISERLLLCAAPVSIRGGSPDEAIAAFAQVLADKRTVDICDIPEIPLEILDQPMSSEQSYLEGLEKLHKTLNLYLWLHYRFTNIYGDPDMATRAKELTEEKISACLVAYSANPKLQKRLKKIQQASSLLREQTSTEHHHENVEPTMNPDASVEEVERRVREEEDDRTITDFIHDDESNEQQPQPRGRGTLNLEWTTQNEHGKTTMFPPEQKATDEISKQQSG